MKRFTKSNLATALQVLAVIIIFSYAGHSSNTGSKEFSPVRTPVDRDTSVALKPGNSATHYLK